MVRPRVVLLLALLAGIAAGPALALDVSQFRQMLVLQDDFVAELLVDSAAWLSDGRGLVLGGWERWPEAPAVLVAPHGARTVALERPASPQFALSPDGKQIAYWVATGGGWCQLGVTAVTGGPPKYVGEPLRIGPAMHLAWPSQYTLLALLQDGGDCTANAINIAAGSSRPLVQVQGGQWTRLRHWPGWDPVAVWVGDSKKCFRLSASARSEEISADFDYDRPGPDAGVFSYYDPQGALSLGGLTGTAPLKLSDQAGGSCWAPDGAMLMYGLPKTLMCVWASTGEQRAVAGSALGRAGLEGAAPSGMLWSPDGGVVVYWRPGGATGQIYRARLGLEEIVLRIRYEPETEVTIGQPVWVARKLYFDEKGRVKEPVWATLKGQFAVRKLMRGPQETIVEAVNVGGQAGVLERIAGSAQSATAASEGNRSGQVDLKPLPGQYAWLQGTHWAGEPIGIEVRRVSLGATH